MKKISVKILLAFALISTLMAGSLQLVDASQNYKITYSPGAKGSFNQELIHHYQATYGNANVSVSDKTGSVTITVEKEKAMPKVPTVNDITLKDSRYYVKAGAWEPTQAIVTKSATYVVRYDMLNNGKEYTIRFIDSQTGDEIASPIISMANVGDTITYSAKTINSYEFDQVKKSLVISENEKDNIIVFAYTGGRDRNVITNTIFEDTVQEIVTTPVVTPVTPTPNVEDVEQQETPQSDGENDKGNQEEVDKEETPKAKNDSDLMRYAPYGVVAIIIIAGVVYFIVKKKEETES